MKIGVIAHVKHAIRSPFAGGLEMHTHALCQSLRRRGHRVTLFAAAGSASHLGLEAICHPTAGADEYFRLEHRIYLRLMEDLRQRDFDIIHNNSLHYLPPALAGILPMPMVTALHTPPFWEMEGSIRQGRSANSSFVAVSKLMRDLWAPITRTHRVIPNGIDLADFKFAPHPDPSPYLVWSGRLVPEKGAHLALAAARLAGMPLRIAGPISDQPYFDRDIRPWLSEQAQYVGHLNHTALANLIGGALACLFTPLWEEPYGLVLAEALACGTPVAAFARGAVTEILDASCGITVPPDDVAALSRAVRAAQNLSRQACRRRAEAIADGETMIGRYEEVYRQLISKRNPAHLGVTPIAASFPDPSDPRALLDHYMARLPAIGSAIPHSLLP